MVFVSRASEEDKSNYCTPTSRKVLAASNSLENSFVPHKETSLKFLLLKKALQEIRQHADGYWYSCGRTPESAEKHTLGVQQDTSEIPECLGAHASLESMAEQGADERVICFIDYFFLQYCLIAM